VNDITTRIERAATAEPEPRLSLSELRALLADAAALERAQRPIVMQPATLTATAPHPGIDIRIPATPVAPAAARPSGRSWWPIVFIVSGCTGMGSAAVVSATGSPAALAVVFASIAAWGIAAYQLVFVREQ